MHRILGASYVLAFILAWSLATATPTAAAEQSFFEGSWRCQQGMSLNIGRGFGPWYVWRSVGRTEARAFIRKTNTGSWINVGADSDGGWWSTTASGWQGVTLTFTGTYATIGASQSLRQVFTRNAQNAMTIQTFRNGSMVGQVGCNR